MKPSIHQQIAWMERQVQFMRGSIPTAVAEGRIPEEHATHRIACAQAALETLTQLRGIVVPKALGGVSE